VFCISREKNREFIGDVCNAQLHTNIKRKESRLTCRSKFPLLEMAIASFSPCFSFTCLWQMFKLHEGSSYKMQSYFRLLTSTTHSVQKNCHLVHCIHTTFDQITIFFCQFLCRCMWIHVWCIRYDGTVTSSSDNKFISHGYMITRDGHN
jgi:hypothetical protein